ncbi:MAG TPA: hypothetical protein VFT60_04945 [Bryobacteraceae bacterium]|nr:hypothetical protein [Bryobacteraceae bacterium]
MIRVTAAIWLCLLCSFALSAQQDPAPQAAGSGDAGIPGADRDQTPAPVNPKTGLPYTPAELRQMEIDKYDPMKRDVDPATDPNRLTDRQAPTAVPGRTLDPIPGSLADMNAQQAARNRQANGTSTDPGADSAAANGAEYSGPAVLSRSYTLARPMIPRQIQWTGALGFDYSWNSGQAPGAIDGVTSYRALSTQGVTGSWSFGGRHVWRRDQLGMTYSGTYSDYTNQPGLNGANHNLNFDYSRLLSRRISIQFVEGLQDLSQNYSFENPTLLPGNSVADMNLATSPNVQLLNSKTLQSSSALSMTWRQTARLSYNLSSAYFVIGRTEGLGMHGRQFSGDINYRWTRRATVGAYYSFTNYLYSHDISTSDSHNIGLIYSYAINRNTQVQTRFGITRIESLAYQAVPLPPALAFLLGQPSVIVNAYSLRNTSDISVQFVHDFRRSRTANIAYAHGQSPGNGVLLTSIQQTLSAGFTASLLRRRLPVSVGGIYSSVTSSAGSSIGFYRSQTYYVGLSRPLGKGVSASFRINYERYNLSDSPLSQDSIRLSFGFQWGPPESLLRKL